MQNTIKTQLGDSHTGVLKTLIYRTRNAVAAMDNKTTEKIPWWAYEMV
jgi:hypothetical protein